MDTGIQLLHFKILFSPVTVCPALDLLIYCQEHSITPSNKKRVLPDHESKETKVPLVVLALIFGFDDKSFVRNYIYLQQRTPSMS